MEDIMPSGTQLRNRVRRAVRGHLLASLFLKVNTIIAIMVHSQNGIVAAAMLYLTLHSLSSPGTSWLLKQRPVVVQLEQTQTAISRSPNRPTCQLLQESEDDGIVQVGACG